MVDWVKFLRGYLRIRVWGFSPERFINLCGNKGIVLWDITGAMGEYRMCVNLKSFYRLRPLARKTRTRVVVLERIGLPFLMPGLWRRKIFVLGCILALACWVGSSEFIWKIRYNGNEQITEEMLGDFLRGENVHIGMRKSKLPIEELEMRLRTAFPQITWTSIKLVGTGLIIDLKENDVPMITETKETEDYCDLITPYGGRIVSMIVRSGIPKVAIGDEVEKDSVLVEGTVPVYNDDGTLRENQFVHADADVILEHALHYEERMPATYTEKEYTGRTLKKNYWHVGEKTYVFPGKIPFETYDWISSKKYPKILRQMDISCFWGKYIYREYQNTEKEYTRDEAKIKLLNKINAFLATLEEKGVQIIEKDVKIDRNGDLWSVQGNFLVQESVGTQVAIILKDDGSENDNE